MATGLLVPAQINAPSFGELLDTLWNFAGAWLIRYWWFVAILGLLWYAAWYSDTVGRIRTRGSRATFIALRRSMTRFANFVGDSIMALVGLSLAAATTAVFLGQGIGAMAMGVVQFDPVMMTAAAATIASALAAFGLDFVTPITVIGAALFVGFLALFWVVLSRQAGDPMSWDDVEDAADD